MKTTVDQQTASKSSQVSLGALAKFFRVRSPRIPIVILDSTVNDN